MLDLLPDLYDEYPNYLSLAEPIFNNYGGKAIFYGEIVTVECINDNSKVKALVDTDGNGKVMVVQGHASLSNALLGDMLAEKAVKNGWLGIIINGCIRDAGTIETLLLGVKALNTCPIKTEKLGAGNVDCEVYFAGIKFIPGHYVYADKNGVAVSEKLLEL